MLRHLDLDDIRAQYDLLCELHAEGIHQQGMGVWGKRATAEWSAALHALFPVYGHDAFPTLEEQAARLLLGGCVVAHPLTDGNKRLAIAALHAQLLINGFTIHASDSEIVRVVVSTIEARQGGAELQALVDIVAEWIAQHLKRLGG